MSRPRASLVISVYNSLPFLEKVVAAVRRQTALDQVEIVISDDGSGPQLVNALPRVLQGLRWQHVWHPDEGWRKNQIMNRVIEAAESDFLIYMDGDCLPHRHYVEALLARREPGYALTARRVNLSKKLSEGLTTEAIANGALDSLTWKSAGLIFDSHAKWMQGLYLPGWLGERFRMQNRGLLGSNMAFWKADLLAINGFDGRYQQYGLGEDTDTEFRLRLSGIKVKSLVNLAIQYHLWHKQNQTQSPNLNRYLDLVDNPRAWTPGGIIPENRI